MIPRLLEKYNNEVMPELMKAFGIKNKLAVPCLEKIVVNIGVGEALTDVKILERAMDELALITGQRPLIRRSKKAISNFKLKEKAPIGAKVTLRKTHMYEFMDRLVNIAMPRIRDFRGVPPDSFDKAGNYTVGLTDQGIFPEIDYDKLTRSQGMDITFVIKKAGSIEQARMFLKLMGMPFKESKD